ncbi:MAG: asparagine--tRNA ligase [Planctomycetes bacterium]|nr:asparagine--tRNA ligase [Planctomycetota bacterium]
MPFATIAELSKYDGQTLTLRGWLYNRRSSGKIQFLQVRDGSGIVQAVLVLKEVGEEMFRRVEAIPQESSITVTGSVRADARSPGGYELGASDVQLVAAAQPYPIALQAHGVGFLMEQRHLWLRSRKPHATLRVRAEVVRAVRDFLDGRGFVLVDAPILTPAACEGTTTLFGLDYFDEGKAFLSQSGQLYMEAGAMAFGKVYCFGPTFRAEKSKTRRHLTEFWMVEPEIAYGTLDDVMSLAEEFISFIVQRVLERRKEELKILERDTKPLEKIQPPFPKLSYDDAVKILNETRAAQNPPIPPFGGGDFGAPDETTLSLRHEKPVMVHRYPISVKAFYMKRDPAAPDKALCVDVLAPEGVGEIIGGGQREDDLALLEGRIAEHQLPKEAFEWYLDLRRYGSVPHAGFGLGIERTVAWICGTEHVRECIPFPRMMYRIYP